MRLRKRLLTSCLALLCCTSLAGCGIMREPEKELEEDTLTLTPSEDRTLSTNDCLSLYSGQFYVWHNDSTIDISKDILTTTDEINTRFKEYTYDVFKPVWFSDATFDNFDADKYSWGATGRIAWLTSSEIDNVPILGPNDKLLFYTTKNLPSEFLFEKFETHGFSIGIGKVKLNENEHYSALFDTSSFNTTSSAYRTYEDIKASNKDTRNITIEKINGIALSDVFVDPEFQYIKGMSRDSKYNVELYYGTIYSSYEMYADSLVLSSNKDKSLTSVKYNYLSSTVIEVILPEELEEGFYYIHGRGFIYYSPNNINSIPESAFTSYENLQPETEDSVDTENTEDTEDGGNINE